MWKKLMGVSQKARLTLLKETCSAQLERIRLKATGSIHGFNADERGLSGVVVAILLILVAVLAIVIIWGFLSGYLEDLWSQIAGNTIA